MVFFYKGFDLFHSCLFLQGFSVAQPQPGKKVLENKTTDAQRESTLIKKEICQVQSCLSAGVVTSSTPRTFLCLRVVVQRRSLVVFCEQVWFSLCFVSQTGSWTNQTCSVWLPIRPSSVQIHADVLVRPCRRTILTQI